MSDYEAVLFDWMLTLADYPDEREHVRRAHEVLGREIDADALEAIAHRLVTTAADDTDVCAAMAHADCSVAQHQEATMLHFERAGVDAELASSMYDLLGDPTFHPLYGESADVLRSLVQHGVRVAVISDIHVDLRAHAKCFEIGDLVNAWILSYERGVQKPDPTIFQLALDELDVTAEQALMVGDRASHDGGAAALGIDTMILPHRTRTATRSNRLDVVLRAVRIPPL